MTICIQFGREELRRFHRSAAKSDHDFFSEKCEEKKNYTGKYRLSIKKGEGSMGND